jgi:hypothetical protein
MYWPHRLFLALPDGRRSDCQEIRFWNDRRIQSYIVVPSIGEHLSECFTLSVILRYKLVYTLIHFAPSVILHPLSFYSLSNFTLLVILDLQSLYSISHFIHSVILYCKLFYNLSNITHSVILHPQSCYIVSHFTM